MIDYTDPKASRGLVFRFRNKVMRRLHALGARSATGDDIEQELWCAWCMARDHFDPEAGVAFSTFLWRGMQMHINRYVKVQYERFHEQTVALSLDYEQTSKADDGAIFSECIPDPDAADPADVVMRSDMLETVCHRLSPRAEAFVRTLADPPQEILSELRRLPAKAEHARSMGHIYAVPSRLTSAQIFDLMGASRHERTKILKEITKVVDKVNR